ncbi:ROK family protein [Oceanibaculum indicum]|uniref:Fructokinase n=1 Tax=Oceanibaculum indicum TaxID=526216 RepID=A0A420WI54_9PROT|nr:ROK family protein [Oceanibaculum indicum]RKQ70688.1 fructokinase [Oceanibaculum indicum]
MRIGIDLGGTKIEIAALDEADGAVLARERIATPRGDYDATIAAIRDLVAGMEARLGRGGTVGIGIPGAISPASGLVKNANSTWLIGRPFDRDLEVALGRPVRLANDANCFALSEAVDGSAAGAAIMFGVILGTGVGGGIVVNGRVLTGANAISGEWGHNPLPWRGDGERPGPACYCGRHGCIETFLSGPGLAADHQRATGTALSAEDVVAAAEAGDSLAEATLRRYEDRLARALAHLVNILDPEVIVLGGGLSGLQRLYESVPHLWGRYIFSDHVATRLLPPVHGDAGGVRGAAWLWPPERDDRR